MDNGLAQVEYSPAGLPPGWIKEIRFREPSSNGKGIKKDPYYTDPDHKYVFRSLKDAIHYVATGEVSKHARRKRTCEMCSLEDASPTTIQVKELNSLGATIRRCLFTEVVETSNAEMATEADDSSKKTQLPPEGTEKDVSIDRSLAIESMKRKTNYKGRQSTRSSKRLAGCGPDPVAELVVCRPSRIEKGDSIELTQTKKERRGKEMKPAAENMLGSSKHVEKSEGKLPTLPSRASKRLAVCGPASVVEPVIHQSSCVGKADSIYSSPDSKEMDPTAENTLGTSKHVHKGKHKVLTLPSRASKRLAGCEPDPVAKLVIGSSSSNSKPRGGNKEQFDDTVPKIEERVLLAEHTSADFTNKHTFPVEEIVTAKQTDERPTSSLAFPFLETWGDPCIEFAVKTLIGEIPVLDEIPEFVRSKMSAAPKSDPTALATVSEFGHQSRAEDAKPSGQPEELQNQHNRVSGKAKPCPLEHGRRRVGQK